MFRVRRRSAILLSVCFSGALLAQVRPLLLNQSRYTVTAGERIRIDGAPETLTFMQSSRLRTAQAAGRSFPVAPNVMGDQILLGVPLTTKPGDYIVRISFTNDTGEERSATVELTVEPLPTVAVGSAEPPVVLLDGWQPPSLISSCPMSSDSTGTFGNLQRYLGGSPDFVPAVYFFENCTQCPNCTIEQLGTDLASFIGSIRYSDGTPVSQVDLIAHSMGGLIVRSYLSGKQQTSGAFSPPLTPLVRKAIFIATPHFGSFQADSALADIAFGLGNQTNEMKRGSQFLWDLATWNQFGDDLRGVDALAVIGNAGGFSGVANASDGVVELSSGSLDFSEPGRTRIVDYCHIPLTPGIQAGYLGCTGAGIANIVDPSHPTYEIISSFLLNQTGWEGIGSSPAQDPYLSKYGGMIVADISSAEQYVTPSPVAWGSVALNDGAAGYLYYQDLVFGTATFNFGSSTCGPYTEPIGAYAMVRCKFAPSVYSIGPLLAGAGRVVQAGTTISIRGTGFGASQCSTCRVTASNPQTRTLQVVSWTNTAIEAVLPASFLGIAQIGVTTAGGFDAINIMAGTVQVPPLISLSSTTLNFTFTVGGAPPSAQAITVANGGGGSLSYSVASNAPWLNASASGSTITASVDTTGLGANSYRGAITVSASGASNTPQIISVVLTVSAAVPSLAVSGVRNSATLLSGSVAPGELVSIFGSGLGPASGVQFSVDPKTGMVDTVLAGTQVSFGSIAAPITYTSATQINAIVPYEIAGQSQVAMQVQYQGGLATLSLPVASASPGAYTVNSNGSGGVVAANQDGTINGPNNPAAKGSYITIYFTGGGETNPPGVTGSVTGSTLKWLTQPVSVTVGGQSAMVTFDGSAPTFVDGVDQLDIQLSPNTPSGAQAAIITVGGISSPSSLTLAVQ